jgi:hypothetical protein
MNQPMQNLFPATFLVNPAVAAPCWAPKAWQMRRFTNPHYANSLWLGAFALVAAPVRSVLALRGLIEGELWMTLWHALIGIPKHALVVAWWGLLGVARAVNLPLDVLVHARTMREFEAYTAIKRGNFDLVRQVRG